MVRRSSSTLSLLFILVAAATCFLSSVFAVPKASNRKVKPQVHEDQPKRPKTAYMLWLADNRASIAESVEGGGTAVFKEAGERWRAIDEKTKDHYTEMYTKEKADFDEKMKAFKAKYPSGKAPVAAVAKSKKDPNAPKRPLSAYFLWLADNRKAIVEKLGPDQGFAAVGVEAGKQWKELAEAQKAPFVEKAATLFEEYKAAKA